MKKMTRKGLTMLLVTTMLAGLLCGCGKDTDNGLKKVTLNEVAHSIFYAPMYVAMEEGYFEEEGLDL